MDKKHKLVPKNYTKKIIPSKNTIFMEILPQNKKIKLSKENIPIINIYGIKIPNHINSLNYPKKHLKYPYTKTPFIT